VSRYEFSGEKLRAFREAAEHTQYSLADVLGRSQPLIALYELGYKQPPAEKLVEIAAVLDVPIEAFFVEVDDEPAVAQ
jgi:transcriptional regulator with XRE-family HTH domain